MARGASAEQMTRVRAARSFTHAPAETRFWRFVEKGDGCWLWTGGRDKRFGYGSFTHRIARGRARTCGAHVFSYELHNGSVPPGMVVRHVCDNPPCVNPAHLIIGTQADNQRDKKERGRGRNQNSDRAMCLRGHAFTPENTKMLSSGSRTCRQCIRERRGRERQTREFAPVDQRKEA